MKPIGRNWEPWRDPRTRINEPTDPGEDCRPMPSEPPWSFFRKEGGPDESDPPSPSYAEDGPYD